MVKNRNQLIIGAIILFLIFIVPIIIFMPQSKADTKNPWRNIIKKRDHLDHSALFTEKFNTPQEVTKACLSCHKDAAKHFMKNVHWKWESEPVSVPGHKEKIKIGKKNLINNFCIGIQGNWESCCKCHAGYGWGDKNFDFKKEENVDCLVCHEWTGVYVKGSAGIPEKGVNLLTVAKSVGYPKRENCGVCHIYGGGAMGVKHGDLDNTMVNPAADVDVHMGKYNLLCIDCHKTENHNIKGKAYSVSLSSENGISCNDCHTDFLHKDSRINNHLKTLACQTCHIPKYSKRAATKISWDWSKAGSSNRKEDIHSYLKIKGEFVSAKNLIPEYIWFNMKGDRYIAGDKINPDKITYINKPQGSFYDKTAKIWPFKVHRGKQPYDKINKTLLVPTTSGKGGYWHEFNWDKAFKLGEEASGIKYSGKYGFTRTDMHYNLSHMISPKTKTLKCCDCHGDVSRFNWKSLGYDEDPINTGGREEYLNNNTNREKEGKE